MKDKNKKEKGLVCRHDYKNAIKVGNIDYQCPLCGKFLDPNEWFFMNSFEFIVEPPKKQNNREKQLKYFMLYDEFNSYKNFAGIKIL